VVMLLSDGQMSGYKGACLIVNDLPLAKHLLEERGYDADCFREALETKRSSKLLSGVIVRLGKWHPVFPWLSGAGDGL